MAKEVGVGISGDCDMDGSVLRNSSFSSPNVLVTSSTYHAIADLVWQGMTVPDACKELGYDFHQVYKQMSVEVRGYLVDVSMVAGCREEYLGERE